MFDLSEQNLTILIVCLGVIFILLLSMRSPRRCSREGMNAEFQKMFDKSNKILCPDKDGYLFKESEIKPEEEIKKITEEVKMEESKPAEEVQKVAEEVKKVAEEVKKVAEEVNIEEENESTKSSEEVKRVAEEVKRVAEEVKRIAEVVIAPTEDVVPEVAPEEVAPEEVVTEEVVTEEVVPEEVVTEEVVTEEVKPHENNVPAPFNSVKNVELLYGHSLGGLGSYNGPEFIGYSEEVKPAKDDDPKCYIYKDAVKKLNLTGHISNDHLNTSWNDAFGSICGQI